MSSIVLQISRSDICWYYIILDLYIVNRFISGADIYQICHHFVKCVYMCILYVTDTEFTSGALDFFVKKNQNYQFYMKLQG